MSPFLQPQVVPSALPLYPLPQTVNPVGRRYLPPCSPLPAAGGAPCPAALSHTANGQPRPEVSASLRPLSAGCREGQAVSGSRSGLAAAACNKRPAGSSTFFDRLRGPLISSFQKGQAVRCIQCDKFPLCRVGGWLWYFRRPFSGSGRKVTSSHPRPMPAEAFPVSAGFVQRGAMG